MNRRRDRLMPVVLFLVLALLAIILWRGQAAHRRELLESYTDTVADQAAIRLTAWFEARMAGLAVMTQELAHGVASGLAPTPPDFTYLARAFQRAQPGFQAINLVDSLAIVRQVVPEADNRGVLGFDLLRHPEASVGAAVARARADTIVTVTGCVSLLQGGRVSPPTGRSWCGGPCTVSSTACSVWKKASAPRWRAACSTISSSNCARATA